MKSFIFFVISEPNTLVPVYQSYPHVFKCWAFFLWVSILHRYPLLEPLPISSLIACTDHPNLCGFWREGLMFLLFWAYFMVFACVFWLAVYKNIHIWYQVFSQQHRIQVLPNLVVHNLNYRSPKPLRFYYALAKISSF